MDHSTGIDSPLLLRYVPADARRVLDAACGQGALARAIKRFNACEVIGISEHPEPAATADGACDRVFPGTPETAELPYPAGYFDAAVCDGALARVRDHAAALRRLAGWLRPGGRLVVQAPNLQYYETALNLFAGRWEAGSTEALDRRNLRFFTAFSLAQSVAAAGFACDQVLVARLAPESALPRDADGYIRAGRCRIGPVDAHGYGAFRAKSLIVVATRKEAAAA